MRVDELFTPCCPDTPPLMEAEYQGKTVELNSPKRGGTRKFYVFVKNEKGNVIKVSFGDPNGEIANGDPKRAASFRARHKCAQETNKLSANYWSCNVARYAKQLGLSSSRPW